MASSEFQLRDALKIITGQFPIVALHKLTTVDSATNEEVESWSLYVANRGGEDPASLYSVAHSPAEALFSAADCIVRDVGGGAWQMEFQLEGV